MGLSGHVPVNWAQRRSAEDGGKRCDSLAAWGDKNPQVDLQGLRDECHCQHAPEARLRLEVCDEVT